MKTVVSGDRREERQKNEIHDIAQDNRQQGLEKVH